jgi:ribosomal protein L16 Arg81 hydroxylase
LTPHEKRPKFNPDNSTLHWYLNEYPKLNEEERPMECLLRPGEVIYFPDKWYHATLNEETSVFISTFLSPIRRKSNKNEL